MKLVRDMSTKYVARLAIEADQKSDASYQELFTSSHTRCRGTRKHGVEVLAKKSLKTRR